MGSKKYYKMKEGMLANQNQVDFDGLVGPGWRAWEESGRFLYEFDGGRLFSEFKVVEISAEDFNLLERGAIAGKNILEKYT